MHVVQNIH